MGSHPGYSDELFRQELEVGHRWAGRVVDRLRQSGVDARLSPMEWRDGIDDRHRFAGEVDIVAITRDGPFVIESKSRALEFREVPSSYPHRTVFVDTVSGWEKKRTKPRAVVFTSQITGSMLALSPKCSTLWTVAERFDRIRRITDRWYEADRGFLVPFDDLVSYLISQKGAM